MHRAYTKLFLVLFLILATMAPSLKAGEIDESELGSKLPKLLGSSNVGKKFYLTVPPCYEEESQSNNFVRVFVISASKTKVSVKVPDKGFERYGVAQPNELLTFDLGSTIAQVIPHNGQVDQPSPAGVFPGGAIIVESESPVVVYVIVRYIYTSDGYLAIPINGLGKEYIAATVAEAGFMSSSSSGGKFTPWVSVVAPYDKTTINVTIGGGSEIPVQVKTSTGKLLKSGQKEKFTLNSGDVFLMGVANFFGDLSGTKVTSNLPVSFFTAHHCANIPLGNRACDYTIEQDLPTSTWGKEYHVPMIPYRKYPGLIVIRAKEANTTVLRDGKPFTFIKTAGGAERGTGFQYERVWPVDDPLGPRPATFTADKPIAVMYLNPGVQEDGGNVQSDPFFMLITPVEQFQKEITFCTPNAAGGERFNSNYLTVVYELDDNGLMPEDIQFAILGSGGTPQWINFRDKFTGSDYKLYYDQTNPNAKRYGTRTISLPAEGVFGMRSTKTLFGCYSFGYGTYDSYGYPTSASVKDLDIQDTMKPRPEYYVTCDGNVDPEVTKVTDYPFPTPAEERSNMSEMYMLTDSSYNYEFISGPIVIGETITTNWGLKLQDPTKSGKAVIRFIDRAGNDTTITITYEAINWAIRQDTDYGQFKLGDAPMTKDFEIQNLGKGNMVLKELKLLSLKGYQGFKLEPLSWSLSSPFTPGETRKFSITFTADNKLPNSNIFEDVVQAMDTCLLTPKEIKITANTGAPKIEVDDAIFATPQLVGALSGKIPVQIRNTGNAELKITGYTSHTNTSNYIIDWNGLSFTTPLIIQPGEYETFYVTFKATAVQKYPDQIVFQSDAGTYIDNVCLLNGEGIQPSLSVNGYTWPYELRMSSTKYNGSQEPSVTDPQGQLPITIKNTGSASATIQGISRITVTKNNHSTADEVKASFLLKDPSTGKIESLLTWETKSFPETLLQADKELLLAAYFRPVAIGDMAVEIEFTNNIGATLVATLEGKGKAPSVKITKAHDFGKTLKGDYGNEQNPDTPVEIEAYGGEYSDNVMISNIITTNEISSDIANFSGKSFKYDGTVLKANTLLLPGQKLVVPAKFVAANNVSYSETLTIESDAEILAERTGYDNYVSTWTGLGTSEGSSITGGNSKLCVQAQSTIKVTVTNTGDEDIVVKSLNIGSNAMFLTWNTTGTSNDITNIDLKAGETKTFDLDFKPLADLASTDVTITMTTDELTNNVKTTIVRIESYSTKANSTSSVNHSSIIFGQDFDYTIKYDTKDKVSASNVTEFRVNIYYKDDYIKPVLDISNTNDASKYTLHLLGDFATNFEIVNPESIVPTVVSGTEKQLSFLVRAKGSNMLGDNGSDLLTLKFKAYLPSYDVESPVNVNNLKIDITHELFDLNPDKCFEFTGGVATSTNIAQICAFDKRPILSGKGYYLQGMNPNPVNANGGDINFSIGFSENATMTIVDAAGNVVSELFNKTMEAGEHSVRIPIEELSSGVYFYQLKSGAYQETKSLVITK